MAPQVLRLNHPYLAPNSVRASVQYPRTVYIEAPAIFQILNHATRVSKEEPQVMGAILGTRSEDGYEVEVKSAYIIPARGNDDEVSIDVEYHYEMFMLLKRSFPDLQIVGWYSTSSRLQHLSGMIQDFIAKENGTAPYPPIHLTVDFESEDIDVQCYVSLPLWASQEAGTEGNCVFSPIQTIVRFSEGEKSLLSLTAESGDKCIYGLPGTTDEAIEGTLKQINDALELVKKARSSAADEKSDELARYLFSAVSNAPVLEAPSIAVPHKVQQQGGKYDPRSAMYNAHMRDLMSLVNLTSSIRWQVQLTSDVTSNLA